MTGRPTWSDPASWPPSVAGMPVCPVRHLPIPYIAEVTADGRANFTILDDAKADRCLRFRLCAMCGGPMGTEIALIGDPVALEPGGWFIEPPVHEQCGADALAGMCPFLSSARVPRRDHSADPTVAVAGQTPAELTAVGRTITKRPLIMAVCRSYRTTVTPSHAGSPLLVYLPGRVTRVRTFGYGDDGWLTETTPAPAPAPAADQPRTRRVQRTTTKTRRDRRR